MFQRLSNWMDEATVGRNSAHSSVLQSPDTQRRRVGCATRRSGAVSAGRRIGDRETRQQAQSATHERRTKKEIKTADSVM
mmetsp:Transcript_47524/g.93741  ORF Transcript_47524/g.93741 Transcript_47524/m.93741 type:complete len:80 (-) Transcript_47524:74-313(-)